MKRKRVRKTVAVLLLVWMVFSLAFNSLVRGSENFFRAEGLTEIEEDHTEEDGVLESEEGLQPEPKEEDLKEEAPSKEAAPKNQEEAEKEGPLKEDSGVELDSETGPLYILDLKEDHLNLDDLKEFTVVRVDRSVKNLSLKGKAENISLMFFADSQLTLDSVDLDNSKFTELVGDDIRSQDKDLNSLIFPTKRDVVFPAIRVMEGAKLELILRGDNYLSTSGAGAGISVNSSPAGMASLEIKGDGRLDMNSRLRGGLGLKDSGALIGGDYKQGNGPISIGDRARLDLFKLGDGATIGGGAEQSSDSEEIIIGGDASIIIKESKDDILKRGRCYDSAVIGTARDSSGKALKKILIKDRAKLDIDILAGIAIGVGSNGGVLGEIIIRDQADLKVLNGIQYNPKYRSSVDEQIKAYYAVNLAELGQSKSIEKIIDNTQKVTGGFSTSHYKLPSGRALRGGVAIGSDANTSGTKALNDKSGVSISGSVKLIAAGQYGGIHQSVGNINIDMDKENYGRTLENKDYNIRAYGVGGPAIGGDQFSTNNNRINIGNAVVEVSSISYYPIYENGEITSVILSCNRPCIAFLGMYDKDSFVDIRNSSIAGMSYMGAIVGSGQGAVGKYDLTMEDSSLEGFSYYGALIDGGFNEGYRDSNAGASIDIKNSSIKGRTVFSALVGSGSQGYIASKIKMEGSSLEGISYSGCLVGGGYYSGTSPDIELIGCKIKGESHNGAAIGAASQISSSTSGYETPDSLSKDEMPIRIKDCDIDVFSNRGAAIGTGYGSYIKPEIDIVDSKIIAQSVRGSGIGSGQFKSNINKTKTYGAKTTISAGDIKVRSIFGSGIGGSGSGCSDFNALDRCITTEGSLTLLNNPKLLAVSSGICNLGNTLKDAVSAKLETSDVNFMASKTFQEALAGETIDLVVIDSNSQEAVGFKDIKGGFGSSYNLNDYAKEANMDDRFSYAYTIPDCQCEDYTENISVDGRVYKVKQKNVESNKPNRHPEDSYKFRKINSFSGINEGTNYYDNTIVELARDKEIVRVAFDANGGSFKDKDLIKEIEIKKGESPDFKEEPLRKDYEFKAWTLDRNGSQPVDLTEAVEGDLTLYAKWEKTTGPGPIVPEEEFYHEAYLFGYPDGTVRPENFISREEVAAVFYRLLDPERRVAIYSEDNFYKDVPKNSWSNIYISSLTKGLVLQGYGDGQFKPRDYMTRAEAVSLIFNYFEMEYSDSDFFKDIEGHWAEKYIETLEVAGIIEGYGDGNFHPDKYIGRGEFANIVNGIFKRGVEKENILDGIKEYKDLDKEKWYYLDIIEASNNHKYVLRNQKEVWKKLKN